MSSELHSDLERLKERQVQLHHAVDLLGVHITALERRMTEEAGVVRLAAAKLADSETGAPVAVPPVLVEAPGGNIEHPTSNIQQPMREHILPATFNLQPVTARPSPPPPLPPVAFEATEPAAATGKPESFEMRLGTYWLVRVGIVAMLTALVFFGAYAYQNFIPKLGPAAKVALLYVASGALLGFGAWFQRRAAKESLRNYAQVVLAGGMAAVYFTTYAAHHFPNLQVIGSATLDGALLLGWAGVMAWTADRKKSEVFAMFAIGLAYYTSVITRVGYFTLYSNLVLAAAALFFLVRNRWAKLSFASLVATYASYGFWRFYSDAGWHWAGPDSDLWAGVYFIAAYWVVFTTAVFLSRHKEFAGVNRASFATLNNAAFFVMFLLTMFQVHSGGFWRFCLGYGTVLLGTAALSKVRLRDEPLAANTYLTQGLLLVTVGIIAKFSGMQLALLLGLESVVLWLTGTLRRNIVMRTGACVSAALATFWAVDGISPNDSHGLWLGAGVGALLAFNAFWSHWRGQGNSPRLMRAAPTYFSALTLLIWSLAIWQNVAEVNRPVALALAALLLAASIHVTRLRELSLLGQLLLPGAVAQFLAGQILQGVAQPWWAFACVGGVALALVHWWQKQTVVECPPELRTIGQFVSAVLLAALTGFWAEPKLNEQQWLLLTSGILFGATAYGAVTRNWVLALVTQVFAGIGVGSFAMHAGTDALPWLPALAPLAALTVLAIGGRSWADAQAPGESAARWVRGMALWYGRAAMALVIWWTFQYAGSRELVWSFTALGLIAFAIAGWRGSRIASQEQSGNETTTPHPASGHPLPIGWGEGRGEGPSVTSPTIKWDVFQDFLVFSTVLNLCALGSLVFHLLSGTAVYWANFVAVLVWMAEQQVARRQAGRYPVPAGAHNLAMVGAGVALWWLVSRSVMQGPSGFYLTASWSVFAFVVFALGMGLRERMYRWVGLGVLAAAVGRVVIFDVWRLETVYRILSFFALGLVLLVLGFIYNKYQERIREWL